MATTMTQKETVLVWKRETFYNIEIISKLQPMSSELSRLVFKDNVMEKPTQSFLNHLCYYLVSIIDKQVSASFSWPIYDSKTEKVFRNELAKFICDYSNKGLLSPVLASYLVNPSSYKVQKLFYQLSELAVQKLIAENMKKDSQKKLYNEMTDKYKSNDVHFIKEIDRATDFMLSKFSNYMKKRKIMEKIAELLYNKTVKMQEKLNSTKAVEYINSIVNNYVDTYNLDETTKTYILSIKDIKNPSKFFDDWLYVDNEISHMEKTWRTKMKPFFDLSQATYESTKTLISIYTGEMDKNMYMIEYNPITDGICTSELQNQVNSEQKYILKNILRDDCLNFPNLVRGFLIAISFILKNTEIEDEIYRFNECLENGSRSYKDILSTLQMLVNRVMNTEADLQENSESPALSPEFNTLKPVIEIPVIPDLSDIRSNKHLQYEVSYDTFTPLNTARFQFNLLRRSNLALSKPRSKSLFATPYFQASQDVFMKTLMHPCYDPMDMTQNFHNLSIVPPAKANETIAECGTGFTKQQIMRLLSTKKSSVKKYNNKQRSLAKVVKAGLFNESSTSDESNFLFRSHSSPNLFENRDKKHIANIEKKRLSIMAEDFLEVSGIIAFDSKTSTPQAIAESSREGIPAIIITPHKEDKINNILHEMEKELEIDLKAQNIEKTETPKMNPPMIKKTSSLEKIINRFKKVRASVLPGDNKQEIKDFKTIIEEKENVHNVGYTAKILLPDLLSPSCSVLKGNSDYLDKIVLDIDEKFKKTNRQSLGTALGVDDTFLDQCDFID